MHRTLDENPELLRKLFRVKKTEVEMLAHRGYDTTSVLCAKGKKYQTLNLQQLFDNATLDDFLQYRRETGSFASLHDFGAVYNKAGTKTMVMYLANKPGEVLDAPKLEPFNKYILSESKVDTAKRIRHFILVTEAGMSAGAITHLKSLAGYKIETFDYVDLAFNRTKHALAPISTTHIPARQVPEWAEKEQIQYEYLPLVLNTDPLAKWYGAEPMDVFQHIIMGTTTDTTVYYRLCRMGK